MDDDALFYAFCRGDRDAGEALFDRYYERLARFFHNKVSEAATADLIQATFLACTEGRERYRGGEGGFRSYLFAIAHNLLRMHYRSRQSRPDPIDFGATSAQEIEPSISEILRGREEQRLLLEALRRIPIECQEVLELHYWEQLGTAEIGEIVGVPAGTVKSRLQRGRRLLEEKLRALASSPQVLASTLTDLDRWAEGLRDRRAQPRD
jgi:RNA polymerase sigma-70 factor (ECF subfamily)